MNRGLWVVDGDSETARAAACANWLFDPTTNASNLLRGFIPCLIAPSESSSWDVGANGSLTQSAWASTTGPLIPLSAARNLISRGLPSTDIAADRTTFKSLLSIQN